MAVARAILFLFLLFVNVSAHANTSILDFNVHGGIGEHGGGVLARHDGVDQHAGLAAIRSRLIALMLPTATNNATLRVASAAGRYASALNASVSPGTISAALLMAIARHRSSS